MKTKLLTIIILLCFTVQGFAQNNDMKARMEYEDAETAYQSQDYQKAVTHLENAENLLGKPTGKTRYLLILALNKNFPQDYEYQDLEKLKKLSKHYLDNYTTDTEKYRDIYDLFNYLDKNYPKSLIEYNQIKEEKENQKRLFQQQKEQARNDFFNTIRNNMILVQGGTFDMGSKKGNKDEKPVHPVTVNTFSISKYEVTVAQYKKFCEATRNSMPKEPKWGWIDDHPIVYVSWEDAVKFTQWLSKELGGEWRLPTEAEWEYAARGGNKSNGYTYSGSNDLGTVGWNGGEASDQTQRIGSKNPNEIGIYDMSGNVWEWCSDWYGVKYYKNSPSTNPKGPSSGSYRVLRGGSWDYGSSYCRVASRSINTPDSRRYYYGFRVVLSQ